MDCTRETHAALTRWLASAEAGAAEQALRRTGLEPVRALAWIDQVTPDPASVETLRTLRDKAIAAGLPAGSVVIERWLLVRRALHTIDTMADVPLGAAVRRLTCAEIRSFAEADEATLRGMSVEHRRFREFARLVSGRRFSAGVFHWEPDGIPLSYLARVPANDWIRVARALARMGGRRPVAFIHLNGRRATAHLIAEELDASYAAMAEALEEREDLRGIVGASWLRSPDTHAVSPRLAVVNAAVLEGGGVVTRAGTAATDSGVFARSETRRRLYEQGQFRPTIGLTIWPRTCAIRWLRARRHWTGTADRLVGA